MAASRSSSLPQTRCVAESYQVMRTAQALVDGNVYVSRAGTSGGEVISTSDIFDATCPDVASRRVSIWAFGGGGMVSYTHGFVDARMGVGWLEWFAFTSGDTGTIPIGPLAEDDCSGSVPLAQTLCRSAREFPDDIPAVDELRQVLIFTSGAENASDLVALPNGEARCVNPGETVLTWGPRVADEFSRRGIDAHVFYYANRNQNQIDTNPTAMEAFLQSLTLPRQDVQALFDSLPLAEEVDVGDSDGDQIPNYRDQCRGLGACAGDDQDLDSLPDATDLCPRDKEDGLGAYPMDGCPDHDEDGVINSADQCPQGNCRISCDEDGCVFSDQCPGGREDYGGPIDGCGASVSPAVPAVVPAAPAAALGALAIALAGAGVAFERPRRASRRRPLC
jgi:hypothetical protein